MLAVEKIKNDKFFATVGDNGIAYVLDLAIDEALTINCKIEAVYNSVIEFIKWYNENKDNDL